MNFNIITSILSLLWVLLVGTSTDGKVRLAKQPTKEDDMKNISNWFYMNLDFIALAAILIFLVAFVIFCYWFVGVSAVESGTVYNHMEALI